MTCKIYFNVLPFQESMDQYLNCQDKVWLSSSTKILHQKYSFCRQKQDASASLWLQLIVWYYLMLALIPRMTCRRSVASIDTDRKITHSYINSSWMTRSKDQFSIIRLENNKWPGRQTELPTVHVIESCTVIIFL